MSLEEMFETLMKSYQTNAPFNQDLKQRLDESEGQNAYLRKQLGKPMKLKAQIISKRFWIHSR